MDFSLKSKSEFFLPGVIVGLLGLLVSGPAHSTGKPRQQAIGIINEEENQLGSEGEAPVLPPPLVRGSADFIPTGIQTIKLGVLHEVTGLIWHFPEVGKDGQPLQLSLYDAQRLCSEKNARLPTDAEAVFFRKYLQINGRVIRNTDEWFPNFRRGWFWTSVRHQSFEKNFYVFTGKGEASFYGDHFLFAGHDAQVVCVSRPKLITISALPNTLGSRRAPRQ